MGWICLARCLGIAGAGDDEDPKVNMRPKIPWSITRLFVIASFVM